MLERGLSSCRVEAPSLESAAEARQRLQALFPRTALRRMTQLGMLVGSVLDGWTAQPTDAVYYATANAEAKSLEDYLRSFPLASPLLFQTSVHPSAFQQVMIGRQQPIGRFVPLAGAAGITEQAILAALIDPAERAVLIGGEERGTWLTEANAASADSFAFAFTLVRGPGERGALRFDPDAPGTGAPPSLREVAIAATTRIPLSWQSPTGAFCLTWA